MRELAAGWAGDHCAPVPVLVPLRDLARRLARDGGGVSLVLLVEVALAGAATSERRLLVEELVARLGWTSAAACEAALQRRWRRSSVNYRRRRLWW